MSSKITQAEFHSKLALVLQLFQSGQHSEADRLAMALLASRPNSADILVIRGVIAGIQNRYTDAEQLFRNALKWDKNNFYIFYNLAKTLSDKGNDRDALKWHRKALDLNSSSDGAWLNYGRSLCNLGEIDDAIKAYDRALIINNNFSDAYTNKGICYCKKLRLDESIALHDQALRLNPELAEAWNNRGNALSQAKRYSEALASFEQSIRLRPKYAEAWLNQGIVLNDLGRYEEAINSYERALELSSDLEFVRGDLVHIQMKICSWAGLKSRIKTLENSIISKQKLTSPFPILGLFDSPHLQKLCAATYVKDKFSPSGKLGALPPRSRRDKVRIGYFSADFGDHPVSHLIVELIEAHDRSRFEVYGFSFGDHTNDPMRQRMERAFDCFLDVKHVNDLEIVRLSRQHMIDIAVDLGGHTKDSRPKIFVERVAPIQINYLGYPGTWGSDCMDYFIGDKVTVSDENREQFSEKIIFLPNCFQVNPSNRPIANDNLSRETHGLPYGSFVFCCFNSPWKITPEILNSWSRILRGVENSVLWLQGGGRIGRECLLKEFESLGIGASRIVFAERLPSLAEHLARYKEADLFLDTFPYGAHTTASDALWSGLPVLTRSGKSFASRVAASLLHAVKLPELITNSSDDYEILAIKLAQNRKRISNLKVKLVEIRSSCSLFNTTLFTQHLESAYTLAYDRHHFGLPLQDIYVEP